MNTNMEALNRVQGYDRARKVAIKMLAWEKAIPEICPEEKVLTRKEMKRVLDPDRMTGAGLAPTRCWQDVRSV